MEEILNNPQFQKILADIAEQSGESIEEVNKEAAECLNELYTEHQPIANVMGTQMAKYILSRGYEKTIDINPDQLQAVTKIARRHPIAFVMTHKTYIDMFVLAVVLGRHGLPIPFTFAGVNMSFMGLGQFGRKNGVIFIRRSFHDKPVYKAALRQFISYLVAQNSNFMWAIEGTRSRTGKLVWPKMGILKYIKEAEHYSGKEVKYIPVSIVYDLIPDVKDMTMEAMGKVKSPESLTWFLNYIRKMGEGYGKISVRLGDPVTESSQNTSLIHQLGKISDDGKPKSISYFAMELVHQINQITPVTTASLVCVILLSKYTLPKKAIESYVAVLMQLIESYRPDALVDRGRPIGESVQTALNLLKKAELVKQHGAGLDSKYVISSYNYLQATYYSNMAVHHLYHQAFIELALLKIADTTGEDPALVFWEQIMKLRNLFKFEFFFSKKEKFTEEIERNIAFLDPNWEETISKPKGSVLKLIESQRMLVAPVVLSTYLEAYRVVLHCLKEHKVYLAFNEKQFLEDCLFTGEAMQWQGQIQRMESVSKPFLQNGIRLVKNMNLIPTLDDDKRGAIDEFINGLDDLADRISRLQRITLTKPPQILPSIPLERNFVPGSKTEGITKEIMESESGPHIGAFFDLDKTLIRNFSAKEFMQARVLSGKMTTQEILAQFSGILVYAGGNRNFAGLAAVSAKGVKGIDEKVFLEMGEDVFLKHLSDEVYPEARELVAAHMEKGHTLAIISAATPYQVDPVARDFGIEHVMCTRMEVKNGKFTGEIVQPACWGDGKAFAAKKLAEDHNLDLAKSYFYTDSSEDMPLLEIVGKPRPMNPDTKLSAIAFKNDWPIYRFDDEERPGVSGMLRTGLALGSLIPAAMTGLAGGLQTGSWSEGVNSLMSTTGDLVCSVAGIQLVVKGEENLWNHRPAVFIFNHQSNVDLFIAAKLIRKNATGVAKKELQYMPVIGQMMQAAGVIFIDRKNREKAVEALQPVVGALKNGTSLIIFPEGTRSYDYRLGKFKKGAFHMAMEAGVPIVPVIIRNAHDAMPRGTNIFKPAAIDVTVLPAIETKEWKKRDLNKKIGEIRGMYLKELGQEEFVMKEE